MRDEVYREPQPQIVDFVFDARVAAVFPDMIRRSVPGYETVVPMTGLLAARHLAARADGMPARLYDLGCSLGASTAAVLQQLGPAECEILAVDNAPAMLARAATHISDSRVQWLEEDLATMAFQPATVALGNWVLQFLPPEARLPVLARLREALSPAGVLILSEKVAFDDPEEQAWFDQRHLDFKRANGYSELELSQKRAALEQVMRLDTVTTQHARLREAGFRRIRPWFQCLNWVSLLAYP